MTPGSAVAGSLAEELHQLQARGGSRIGLERRTPPADAPVPGLVIEADDPVV